jgi:leader peptidase (prepilin peptidase)/N-methyltransferase
MIFYVWPAVVLLWLFVFGAAVGSFLNVCIYRIPAGKSLTWPGSRCGHCFHEVRLKDNVPLVSYWVLRGRCRDCGARFSMRYFWVELLTAVSFVAVYVLEIGLNVQHLRIWLGGGFADLQWVQTPLFSWQLFAFHAALASFLIAATGCLLDHGRVPPALAVTGALIGLCGAVLFPWPFPETPNQMYLAVDGGTYEHPLRGPMPSDESWASWPVSPRPGFYPWPVWGPLPDALPPGTWQLGLATGLAGALVGGWSLRLAAVAGGQSGRESPAGAADLAMIAGAFLGWQPVLVAVVGTLAASVLLSPLRRHLPFGLLLVVGIVAAWLGWAWVGPVVRPVLFSPAWLLVVAAASLLLGRLASR